MRYSTTSNPPSPRSSESLRPSAISLRGVNKRFYYDTHRTNSLREWFIHTVLRRPGADKPRSFTVESIDLEVRRGEAVALVGRNGSGKSTLLRLIAGIYEPSGGEVRVEGRVSSVLELGAGFHPELSGADNVVIYAAVLGIRRRELGRRFEKIVDFSGIRDFLEMPVKHYSSGMQARLALSVALCSEPDVLLLDEALSVGDQGFREKVFSRVREYHRGGGTVIMVTHTLDQVIDLCDRAVWIDRGRKVMEGKVRDVVDRYGDSSLGSR